MELWRTGSFRIAILYRLNALSSLFLDRQLSFTLFRIIFFGFPCCLKSISKTRSRRTLPIKVTVRRLFPCFIAITLWRSRRCGNALNPSLYFLLSLVCVGRLEGISCRAVPRVNVLILFISLTSALFRCRLRFFTSFLLLFVLVERKEFPEEPFPLWAFRYASYAFLSFFPKAMPLSISSCFSEVWMPQKLLYRQMTFHRHPNCLNLWKSMR